VTGAPQGRSRQSQSQEAVVLLLDARMVALSDSELLLLNASVRSQSGWRTASSRSQGSRPARGQSSAWSSSGRCFALPAQGPAVACGEDRNDRLATVPFASARYSVPHRLVGETVQVAASDRDVAIMHAGVPVAQHALLAPGEASITDLHYPRHRHRPASARCGPARHLSTRSWRWAQRPSATCARLGRRAPRGCTSAWLRRSASRARVEPSRQRPRCSTRARSVFAHGDLASIADGLRAARRASSQTPNRWSFKNCRRSPCARSATTAKGADERRALDAELESGLRRLRLTGMRELAPELLQTAKTQRWPLQEPLATLVREEIAASEASNERARLKAAGFPGQRRSRAVTSRPRRRRWARLSSFPRWSCRSAAATWLSPAPAGVGKSHLGRRPSAASRSPPRTECGPSPPTS
jgi:Mu transposase, C-terminal domain